MREGGQLKQLNDYDYTIEYHPIKSSNNIAYPLSYLV